MEKKVRLWVQRNIIHFEFLNRNTDLYSQKLQHVQENLLRLPELVKRRNLVLPFITQNHIQQKFSQEDLEKTFVEKFLCSKPAEFYLRGINKLPDKGSEGIQNNGQYTNDWN